VSVSPRVALGLPLYNSADHVEEALESLLTQTYESVVVIAVDDSSSDDTCATVRDLASGDDRLLLFENERRLGLVGNWRRCFELARERAPHAAYFAWTSDHDAWHPRWLEAMVGELEAHPEAVLAYPVAVRVDARGELLQQPWSFDTAGLRTSLERFRAASRRMVAGDMIYGLARVSALERAGPFPLSLMPDRLLLAQLSLLGEFRQVPEALWQRRVLRASSIHRQRRALFGRRRPWHTFLPWWIGHFAVFANRLVLRRSPGLPVGRGESVRAALAYLGASVGLAARTAVVRAAATLLRLAARVTRRIRAARLT
jgi:glycosyltransferase involved in cell wall biosynthesis